MFHKPTIKRAHIRLPILPFHISHCSPCNEAKSTVNIWEDGDITKLLDLINIDIFQVLRQQGVVSTVNQPQVSRVLLASPHDQAESPTTFEFQIFRENTLSILCAAAKSLLSERIVGVYFLLMFYFYSFTAYCRLEDNICQWNYFLHFCIAYEQQLQRRLTVHNLTLEKQVIASI